MEDQVYVIDDDASARNGLARLLRAASYHVHAFESASKFLETLDEISSGCIVLDIRMPGMTGDELALELKKQKVNLPIIVITAEDNAGTRQLAQEMNAQGFFSKPVDGTALLDVIKWVLRSSPRKVNQNTDNPDKKTNINLQ